MNIAARRAFGAGFVLALGVCLLQSSAPSLHADWVKLDLPPLGAGAFSWQGGHLPDGRLVYGTKDTLLAQSTFGLGDFQSYTGTGTWDPSAVPVFSSTLGALGRGGFGPSQIFLFDPSDAGTSFTAIQGVTLQNYGLAFRDSTSLFVGGTNGTGGQHAISYVTSDGLTNKVIIDRISQYSGAFTMDLAGNLYVADNDGGGALYRFTKQQLDGAIAGVALAVEDGSLLTHLDDDASLAVDALGRVWFSGFMTKGIEVFDPATGDRQSFYPVTGSEASDNANYVVSTFLRDGVGYVSYINSSGYAPGSQVTYGYELATNLVPEPATGILLGAGLAAFAIRRRRGAC